MKKYLILGLVIISISTLGLFLAVKTTQKVLAQAQYQNSVNFSWDQPSYMADQTLTATGTVSNVYNYAMMGSCDGSAYMFGQFVSFSIPYFTGTSVIMPNDGLIVADPSNNFEGYVPVTVTSNSYETCNHYPNGLPYVTGTYNPGIDTFTYTADTSNFYNEPNNFPGDIDTIWVNTADHWDDIQSSPSSAIATYVVNHNPPSTYTVSTGGSGCTASPDSQTVNSGDSASVTFTPNDGYTINSNDVSDTCGGGSFDSSSGTYTTGAISNDCEIDAVCEPPVQTLPTVTLTANPSTIQSGGSSALVWQSSTDADSCNTDGWASNIMTNGSQTVSPTTTTTYNITCTNSSGQATASATVTVTNAPIISTPVNGAWGSWGPWSSCSASCGGGTQEESRACDNPAPAYGGSQCQLTDGSLGLSENQTQACNTQPCAPTTHGTCSTTQHFSCLNNTNYDNDGVNNTSDWTWSCTGTDNVPVSCTMQKPKPVYQEN